MSAKTQRHSITVHIDNRLGEGLRSFLRQVVPDASGNGPVRIFARELVCIGAGVVRMRCPIGIAFKGYGWDGDDRACGKPLLQIIIFRLAFRQAESPAVVVDHDKRRSMPRDGQPICQPRRGRNSNRSPISTCRAKALVELRVPFELDCRAIDDVDRGANDSDWQSAKDAARQIAFAEDAAIFEGYAAAGIGGIRQGTSNPIMTLPADVRQYPEALAQGLSRLRLVGVNGPYAVLLGADAHTALAETSDHG